MFSMIFPLEWLCYYIAVMFAMSVDNICWTPTSPEYYLFQKNQFPISVEKKFYNSRLDYIFRYRILSVLKHPRDIFPALLTSLIMAVMF